MARFWPLTARYFEPWEALMRLHSYMYSVQCTYSPSKTSMWVCMRDFLTPVLSSKCQTKTRIAWELSRYYQSNRDQKLLSINPRQNLNQLKVAESRWESVRVGGRIPHSCMHFTRIWIPDIIFIIYITAQSSASSSPSTSQPDTSFVEDAIRKLLKARRVLRASYGYGFFLGRNEQKKIIFELMQVFSVVVVGSTTKNTIQTSTNTTVGQGEHVCFSDFIFVFTSIRTHMFCLTQGSLAWNASCSKSCLV